MIVQILSLAVSISAISAIIFRYQESHYPFLILKPLTTILIISIVAVSYVGTKSYYSSVIFASLIFALIGDIFLVYKKYFLPGLSSFFIAHIGFIIAFSSINGFSWNIGILIPLLIVGIGFYSYLYGNLKEMKIPVLLYISVIVVMNWQAISLYYETSTNYYLILAIASLLFSFSDSIIAIDSFKKKFLMAEFLILSTYWLAIFMIAIST